MNQLPETDEQSILRYLKNNNPDEYNFLLSQMDNHMLGTEKENVFENLCHVSALAEEALIECAHNDLDTGTNSSDSEKHPNLSMEDLLAWKRCEDRKHELFMLQESVMQVKDTEIFIKKRVQQNPMEKFCDGWNYRGKSKVKEIKNRNQKKNRDKRFTKPRDGKKPNCKHFLRGHCKRGKYCDFVHDIKHS